MGMVDQAVINFACYEDAKDFLGRHDRAAQIPHLQR